MNLPVPANSEQPQRKKLRISRKLRKALDLIATGKVSTRKAAALQAGITPEYLSRCLSRPEVRGCLREKAEANISDASMRASSLMNELLGSDSDHVKLKTSLRLLEHEGLLRPAGDGAGVQILNFGRAGFCIDWSNGRKGPSRELTDEEQDELARGSPGIILRPLIDVTPEEDGA